MDRLDEHGGRGVAFLVSVTAVFSVGVAWDSP